MATPDQAEDLLSELYRAHHDEVLAFCVRRIGWADADDVASEVFSIAWRRRDEIEWETARAWLYGIARGLLSNRWRADRRRSRLIGRVSGLAQTPHESPDVVVVQRARDAEVVEVLRTMRPPDREVLMLSAWEELTGAEIAVVLDITLAAAEQRVSRAKRRLATALEQSERRNQ